MAIRGCQAPSRPPRLNERQDERNAFAIVAYQRSTDTLGLQVAAYGRYSGVHFIPDTPGDLFFNGVASDVDRTIASGGLQADMSFPAGTAHTVRAGVMALAERLTADTTTTVFPVDAAGNPVGAAYPIVGNSAAHDALCRLVSAGRMETRAPAHAQLRRPIRSLCVLLRPREPDQPPREPDLPPDRQYKHSCWIRTLLHAAVARERHDAALSLFAGTSNASAVTRDDPVRSERADYIDAGISHSFSPRLQAGIDAYYKNARNQLDDGLFGQSLIQSAFNYGKGRIYGAELTASYAAGGFSAYANLARAEAQGEDWVSSQFLFAPADLAYVQNHWIHLDHDQRISASAGANYIWAHPTGSTRVYADLLFGTGLRTDADGCPRQHDPKRRCGPEPPHDQPRRRTAFRPRSRSRV